MRTAATLSGDQPVQLVAHVVGRQLDAPLRVPVPRQQDETAIHDAAVAAAPGLDASSMTVRVDRVGGQGNAVTVSVAYDDLIRVPFIGWLVGTSVELQAQAVMRQEFG